MRNTSALERMFVWWDAGLLGPAALEDDPSFGAFDVLVVAFLDLLIRTHQ
jgi:hypothetical protein